MAASTAHITTLKGNAQMFLNFDAFLTPRRWVRIDNPGSNIFAKVFFYYWKKENALL
jgi:hypothetical protein